jgi:uncharacterized protein (TIGR03437 family)
LAAGAGVLATMDRLSHDWGRTWQSLNAPREATAMAIHPSKPGWIYMATWVAGRLYVTKDYGGTWTPLAVPNSNFSMIYALAIEPGEPDSLYAGTVDGLWRSLDGGASWVRPTIRLYFNSDWTPQLAVLPQSCRGGGLFGIASGGGLAKSADGGTTWRLALGQSPILSVAAAGCDLYVVRQVTRDAFVAKLRPDGSAQWTTFLGGMGEDVPRSLAVDAGGNVYVAGSTASENGFPVTERHGAAGVQSSFLTKFTTDGRMEWSALLGGSALGEFAMAVALDRSGNAYVLGQTRSRAFPITQGAVHREFREVDGTPYLTKFSPAGRIVYSTLLGGKEGLLIPTALAVNLDGEAFVGAFDQVTSPPYGQLAALVRINASGTSYAAHALIDREPQALDVAPDGTVWSAAAAVPNVVPDRVGPDCFGTRGLGGGAFLQQFHSDTLAARSSLLVGLGGVDSVRGLDIDDSGTITLALSAFSRFPLRSPILGAPPCSNQGGVVARVKPDGSLLFATYLGCGDPPATAWLGDGLLAASVNESPSAAVVALDPQPASPISLNRVTNAFGGFDVVVPGALYSVFVDGMDAEWTDAGLLAAELPHQLAGVQVTFDGIPARLIHTARDRAIVVAPEELNTSATSVQVAFQGAVSSPVAMRVSTSPFGLLTRAYPDPPSHVTDGYIENEDGTINSADNPAARGSTIRVFVTGLGNASVSSSWNPDSRHPLATAPLEGVASGLQRIWIPIPLQSPVDESGKTSVSVTQHSTLPSYLRTYSNSVFVYLN